MSSKEDSTVEVEYCNSDSDVLAHLEETLEYLLDNQNLKGIMVFVSSLDKNEDTIMSLGEIDVVDLKSLLNSVIKQELLEFLEVS
jgi:hypothetical protein